MDKLAGGAVEIKLNPQALRARLCEDVRSGLGSKPKSVPSTWFYDERGSILFDEITRLDEYYQTRTERSLLADHAVELVERSEARTLIELGSGTCEKTRVILDEMARQGRLEGIIPVDISAEMLERSVAELSEEYPTAWVRGHVDDFDGTSAELPRAPARLLAFLGGTIGNLRPQERAVFFSTLRSQLGAEDSFLLGCDLVKDRGRLLSAYDDAAGVTAEFNLNLLAVMNRELGADFELSHFSHVARWNEEAAWIEMWLRSSVAQRVNVDALELCVHFDEGEEMLTEISAKFSLEGIMSELAAAGLLPEQAWTDPAGDFALVLARAARS